MPQASCLPLSHFHIHIKPLKIAIYVMNKTPKHNKHTGTVIKVGTGTGSIDHNGQELLFFADPGSKYRIGQKVEFSIITLGDVNEAVWVRRMKKK